MIFGRLREPQVLGRLPATRAHDARPLNFENAKQMNSWIPVTWWEVILDCFELWDAVLQAAHAILLCPTWPKDDEFCLKGTCCPDNGISRIRDRVHTDFNWIRDRVHTDFYWIKGRVPTDFYCFWLNLESAGFWHTMLTKVLTCSPVVLDLPQRILLKKFVCCSGSRYWNVLDWGTYKSHSWMMAPVALNQAWWLQPLSCVTYLIAADVVRIEKFWLLLSSNKVTS